MKRMTVAALLTASLAISAPLIAQPAATANPADANAVQAGQYKIDTAHTLVKFSVNHFGINDYFGTLPGATGSLTIDPKKVADAKLDVTIPVAGLSTTNKVLDGELVSADWFDAAQYPDIRFVSTRVVKTGANTADVTGNLTFHGVTRPVTLNVTFNAGLVNPMKKVYSLGFKASGTIKRSDFGVNKYVPAVSDETKISITAAFEKQ